MAHDEMTDHNSPMTLASLALGGAIFDALEHTANSIADKKQPYTRSLIVHELQKNLKDYARAIVAEVEAGQAPPKR